MDVLISPKEERAAGVLHRFLFSLIGWVHCVCRVFPRTVLLCRRGDVGTSALEGVGGRSGGGVVIFMR